MSKSVNHKPGQQIAAILNDVHRIRIDGNIFLEQITEKMPKDPKTTDEFIILVDGSRYGIEIPAHQNKTTTLYQHFLHNDRKRKKLVSVSYRKVIIEWD